MNMKKGISLLVSLTVYSTAVYLLLQDRFFLPAKGAHGGMLFSGLSLDILAIALICLATFAAKAALEKPRERFSNSSWSMPEVSDERNPSRGWPLLLFSIGLLFIAYVSADRVSEEALHVTASSATADANP